MEQRLHRLLLLRSVVETGWLLAFLLAAGLVWLVASYRTALVDGQSMQPTIMDGTEVLINLHAYDRQWPARGDVVVFSYPNDPTREFIKRVIAFPGEKVSILNGQVRINEQPLNEIYHPQIEEQNYGPVMIPANTIFVLGDNRPHSSDSRLWGPLPVHRIHGRAQYTVWPLAKLAIIE